MGQFHQTSEQPGHAGLVLNSLSRATKFPSYFRISAPPTEAKYENNTGNSRSSTSLQEPPRTGHSLKANFVLGNTVQELSTEMHLHMLGHVHVKRIATKCQTC